MRKEGFLRRSVSLMVSLLLVVIAVAAGIATTPVSTEAKSKKSAAASGSAYTVAAAVIAGSNVTVTATGSATTDDGLLHLYAFQPYEGGNAGSAVSTGTEVANAPASATAAFTFALGKNTANSNLFKKFAVVGIKGGVLTQLSGAHYITNPEACATHTAARNYSGKKGILPAATMFNTNDLAQLGVQQATTI